MDVEAPRPNTDAPPLVLFDAGHGQRNWAQTGFSSREMHSNFAGAMELLCRMGCICVATSNRLVPATLARARLVIIPPPTGEYNRAQKVWEPNTDLMFSGDEAHSLLEFVRNGGRLLAFGYRFGDSFTRSNARELFVQFGCLLNDDAVIDLQSLRTTYPLDAFFDTSGNSLPMAECSNAVGNVRWRTTATLTLLPGTNVVPLALSAGGNCISFDRSLRRISFASLPIAAAGTLGRGRFSLFGGPHVFETGTYGLLPTHDNARFLRNVLRWLLSDAAPNLEKETKKHHTLGTLFFNSRMEVERDMLAHHDQRTVAYVERVLRQTGILKALHRPEWLP
jgi:hypothetical protein